MQKRNMDQFPSRPHTRTGESNWGMWPNSELNLLPYGAWDDAPTNRTTLARVQIYLSFKAQLKCHLLHNLCSTQLPGTSGMKGHSHLGTCTGEAASPMPAFPGGLYRTESKGLYVAQSCAKSGLGTVFLALNITCWKQLNSSGRQSDFFSQEDNVCVRFKLDP